MLLVLNKNPCQVPENVINAALDALVNMGEQEEGYSYKLDGDFSEKYVESTPSHTISNKFDINNDPSF